MLWLLDPVVAVLQSLSPPHRNAHRNFGHEPLPSPMSPLPRCRECGAELHGVAGERLVCPACSMRLALRPPTESTHDLSSAPPAGEQLAEEPRSRQIGRYRILEAIGEGGMGVVYRAEQREPVRREVAIKLVKLGMDTKQVVARFESERQALALMSHRNIARVFDGGATPEGRPFFVMEYVRGTPITEFCDRHRLDTAARLELFCQVCQGVQHAHQKGIIHRDLKPTNVLVTLEEGEPLPKVIDFGVAKATGYRLTEETVYTQLGQRIGTPRYMSPEQAQQGGLDVDTRTDVYSLGVMLYELLVGAPPFTDPDTDEDFEDVLRRVRESEPPKPSSRLGTLGDAGRAAAEQRRTDLLALRRRLRGDLDWILLKALEKDRSRRYGSPAELAADIERHLRDEPVVAGPPTFTYRFGKLVRRHRIAVLAAALVLASVVVAAVGVTLGLVRTRRAEERALREAAKATAINAFLQDTLGSAEPYERLGRHVTILEALEEAVERIDDSFGEEPTIRAAVEDTIGTTYLRLGRYDEAEPLLRSALQARRRHGADEPEELAATLSHLAGLRRAVGQLDEAESLTREALEIRRDRHGDRDLGVAESLHQLAWILTDKGDFPGAETLFRQSLDIRRSLLAGDDLDIAESLYGLASVLANESDYAAAEPLHRESLEIRRRRLGGEHLLVAASESSLALMLQMMGELEEAETLLRRSLETRRLLLGEEHPDVAESLNGLAAVLQARGDLDAAEATYRELLELYGKILGGGDHTNVARTLHNLASVLRSKGQLEEAEARMTESLEMNRRSLGPEHPVVGLTLAGLAGINLDEGMRSEAEARARQAVEILSQSLPENHWRLAATRGLLGEILLEDGRFGEAEALLLPGVQTIEQALGADSAAARRARERIVRLYETWGRPEDARVWARAPPAVGAQPREARR